jgi:hypothetical protein
MEELSAKVKPEESPKPQTAGIQISLFLIKKGILIFDPSLLFVVLHFYLFIFFFPFIFFDFHYSFK